MFGFLWHFETNVFQTEDNSVLYYPAITSADQHVQRSELENSEKTFFMIMCGRSI